MALRDVVIDTNMFLLPFQRRVDVMAELERLLVEEPHRLVVLQHHIRELQKLSHGVTPEARAARSGEMLAERLIASGKLVRVTDESLPKDVDAATLQYALTKQAWVATNDHALRRKVRAASLRAIASREGHQLVFA